MADEGVTQDFQNQSAAGGQESLEQVPGEGVTRRGRSWLRSTGRTPWRVALVAGLTFVVALGAVCGWLGYRVHEQGQGHQFRASLVQMGRQGAINLTTIDYQHAEADVQRILDSSTGEFYDEFKSRSAAFVDVVKKAKSSSVGTVTEAGLESTNGSDGQVLVAVTVKSSSDGKSEEQPRYWRMRLTVSRQGGTVKVSKVDFVR